ncbi:DUF222 domain-containing protein [Blastococcus sp. SYSU D00820]
MDGRARLLDEGAEWLDAVAELERGLAQLAGARVRALAAFAGCRPSSWDRQPGERGAASEASRAARPQALSEVSEWAAAEVAARLRVPERTAGTLLAESIELVEQLPGTLAALEAGRISWTHARALVELLRPVATGKKTLVEARVLPRAPRQTVAQLRECTRRAIAKIDADAALRRLAQAVRDRRVTRHPGEDGMAVLTAVLAAPVARACHEALRAYAEACSSTADGHPDPRSLDERMADCLADLILRPDAEGRLPVRVLLTLVAGVDTLAGSGPDADEPGEVDGETVPAPLVRELAYSLGLMPRPQCAEMPGSADEGAEPAPGQGAEAEAGAGADGEGGCDARSAAAPGSAGSGERGNQAPAALTALLEPRRLAGTALAERPGIAMVDQLTGCLLALADVTTLRAAARDGRGLGPPAENPGYWPSDPLDRFVRLRDRRCRFPGCRARIRRCDLDHRVPHPHGPTSHDNLEGLCEFHHRLKHQAPGWRLTGSGDGGLVWTLPGGTTITTVPPRFGTDDGSAPAGTAPTETGTAETAPSAARPDWGTLDAIGRRAWIRDLLTVDGRGSGTRSDGGAAADAPF